ncbi:hypothetical protein ACH5RR_003182 [Cinchona calisaya]|uniref:BZIP domain-containing protein n=1 Tax=Cinchona calisaya TaxID=153742 RepID=A0ABD3AU37_9GENT
MAEAVMADSLSPPNLPNVTVSVADDYDGLAIPPLDPTFFSQDITLPDANGRSFDPFDQNDDVQFEDIDFDFDFSLDDLLPASIEAPLPDPGQFDSDSFVLPVSDLNLTQIPSDRSLKNVSRAFRTTSSEFPHISGENDLCDEVVISNSSSPEVFQMSSDQVSGNRSSGMHQISSADQGHDVLGYLNMPSPESNGSKGSNDSRVLNCPSPESQASDNDCGSNVSEESNRSVTSSPNFGNISVKNGVADQNVKLEELNCSINNNSLLKRKKGSEEINNNETRTNKFHKSNVNSAIDGENGNYVLSEEDDKRRARLMRNRESAQLSRQRKKHYVEELEDKVKNMHSTIQDLNAKITYFMAENATLRQQLGGGGVPPPPMPPPPPGMYPPMMYPWMPCGIPPYMMKPQGSQVPLIPIPRLKSQQTAAARKGNKKADSNKSEGRTKRVASVSFLGLLFFILLFGGLVPMVNVRYGGVREAFTGGSDSVENRFYEKHQGRVLTASGNMSDTDYGEKFGGGKHYVENGNKCNGSEPLVASLYVPRNDKLVKIDGNLIIHSVLASEKAMASHKDAANEAGGETRLAVPGDLAHIVPVSGGRAAHLYRSPTDRQRALGSGSVGKENLKSPAADGRLQQWFREGLAGPMLSSGMCTEVFQFDVSSASGPGAIVPATSARDGTGGQSRNSTDHNKGKNRRILRSVPVPLPGSSHNISEDVGRDSQKDNLNGNNSLSSMVVSVLVDPREVGDFDVDVDGVMGAKSLSRIFVVVLIDSVKYVTYSCMLPFKGAGPHLVTA